MSIYKSILLILILIMLIINSDIIYLNKYRNLAANRHRREIQVVDVGKNQLDGPLKWMGITLFPVRAQLCLREAGFKIPSRTELSMWGLTGKIILVKTLTKENTVGKICNGNRVD